jgi:hypothetical protein
MKENIFKRTESHTPVSEVRSENSDFSILVG